MLWVGSRNCSAFFWYGQSVINYDYYIYYHMSTQVIFVAIFACLKESVNLNKYLPLAFQMAHQRIQISQTQLNGLIPNFVWSIHGIGIKTFDHLVRPQGQADLHALKVKTHDRCLVVNVCLLVFRIDHKIMLHLHHSYILVYLGWMSYNVFTFIYRVHTGLKVLEFRGLSCKVLEN